jgi:hypothetical protein
MQDPQAQSITELLGLASEVKTSLRHLETLAAELTSDAHRAAHLPGEAAMGRVRNHLELALQALGHSRRSATSSDGESAAPDSAAGTPAPIGPFPTLDPANPLKITGYYSSEVKDALRELRKARGWQPADGIAPIRPGIWVKNRVDEIHRALSTAFGEDDELARLEDEPQPLGPPEFTGNTDVLSIPELIGFFQLQAKTGVLLIAGQVEDFTLVYQRGELIHAASSASPEGERLGEILVRLGYMNETQLAELLVCLNSMERTGETLRRGEVISEEAISDALQHQVQGIFHRLCTLTGCRFSFREGLAGEPNARARYNVTRLLLETARVKDETAHDESLRNSA